MPYLMGSPLPTGGGLEPPLLFDYDFRVLPTGKIDAATLLAVTAAYGSNVRGLTFTRITNSTVQTSPSTVFPTVGANEACIGNITVLYAKTGLVLQTRNQNTLGTAGRTAGGAGWNLNANGFCGGTVNPTVTSGQPGPDGTSNAVRLQSPDWSSVNNAVGQSRPRTFSTWTTPGNQITLTNDPGACGNTVGSVAAISSGTGWSRLVCVEGSTQTTQYQIVDCRTETAGTIGGAAHQARDVTVDMVQLEQGEFATEAIISGTITGAGMAREDDRLDYGSGTELISSDGQLRVRYTFSPKFSTTMGGVPYAVTSTSSLSYAVHWWLLSWGSLNTNYIRIQSSDKKLAVKFGGSEYVSTNPVAWTQYDTVVLELELGAGIASVARYKLNGGAWVNLVLATIPDTPAPGANPVSIMRNIAFASNASAGWSTDDRGQLPCWLHRITFYGPTPVASQVILAEDGQQRIAENGALRISEGV